MSLLTGCAFKHLETEDQKGSLHGCLGCKARHSACLGCRSVVGTIVVEDAVMLVVPAVVPVEGVDQGASMFVVGSIVGVGGIGFVAAVAVATGIVGTNHYEACRC